MQLIYTPAAQADLDTIWEYTVSTWGVTQAKRYIRSIESAGKAIAAGQKMTQSADYIHPGYRKASVGRHTLYLVTQSEQITVVRILHQRMDVDNQIK